jgi:hypothetical protein
MSDEEYDVEHLVTLGKYLDGYLEHKFPQDNWGMFLLGWWFSFSLGYIS